VAGLLGLLGGILLVAWSAGPAAAEPWRTDRIFLPELRLVDVHSHFLRGEADFPGLAAFMARNGVDLMALSGLVWSDGDTLGASTRYRWDGFLPFLRDFDPLRGESVDYVYHHLRSGLYKGVGELFINGHGRRLPGDHPVLMEIYRVAGSFEVPVLVHWTLGSTSDQEPGTRDAFRQLKRVLRDCASTTFILAHGGLGPPPHRPDYPKILEHLLRRYPNLRLDLSGLHDTWFTAEGEVTSWGRQILMLAHRFPDRLLLGFDLSRPGEIGPEADATARLQRAFLARMTTQEAEAVGRRNALAIFGRCPDPAYGPGRRPVAVRGANGFLAVD